MLDVRYWKVFQTLEKAIFSEIRLTMVLGMQLVHMKVLGLNQIVTNLVVVQNFANIFRAWRSWNNGAEE